MFSLFKKIFNNEEKNNTAHKTAEAAPAQQNVHSLSVDDLERCMLQQTTSYKRGCPIILATNKENDLFLIHYFDNTFFIVKVVYENDKLNVVYDYRRKNPVMDEFWYRIDEKGVTATLKFLNDQVEFVVTPTTNYCGSGCRAMGDQTGLYNQFVSYLSTYRKNINSASAMRRNEKSYIELYQAAGKMSDENKRYVFDLLAKGNSTEAIKQIQKDTGLGLADCKKIADSPYMYL